MNFDSLLLAAVAGELRQTVLGGKVERVTQPEPLTVVLTIFHAGEKRHLLVSCEPNSPRIYLTHLARKNPPAPPNFCMLLRKYLEGAWLEAVEHPFGLGERVLRLGFLGRERARYFLWIELMGKHSNAIFTDSGGMILGALKRVTTQMSRFREIRAGIAYTPPPRQKGGKRDPFSPTAGNDLPDENLASQADAEKWLLASFTAVSPLMAQETMARLPDPPYSAAIVWYALNDILNSARLGDWSARVRSRLGRSRKGSSSAGKALALHWTRRIHRLAKTAPFAMRGIRSFPASAEPERRASGRCSISKRAWPIRSGPRSTKRTPT
jgi:hypothetical protein